MKLPLKIDEFGDIIDANGKVLAVVLPNEDEDHLFVKAVNHHDEVVTALTSLTLSISLRNPTVCPICHVHRPLHEPSCVLCDAARLIERINNEK